MRLNLLNQRSLNRQQELLPSSPRVQSAICTALRCIYLAGCVLSAGYGGWRFGDTVQNNPEIARPLFAVLSGIVGGILGTCCSRKCKGPDSNPAIAIQKVRSDKEVLSFSQFWNKYSDFSLVQWWFCGGDKGEVVTLEDFEQQFLKELHRYSLEKVSQMDCFRTNLRTGESRRYLLSLGLGHPTHLSSRLIPLRRILDEVASAEEAFERTKYRLNKKYCNRAERITESMWCKYTLTQESLNAQEAYDHDIEAAQQNLDAALEQLNHRFTLEKNRLLQDSVNADISGPTIAILTRVSDDED